MRPLEMLIIALAIGCAVAAAFLAIKWFIEGRVPAGEGMVDDMAGALVVGLFWPFFVGIVLILGVAAVLARTALRVFSASDKGAEPKP